MRILHFADLHLGVETYGHTNPETGLSTRLEDFLRAFDHLVDYAIENSIDLVLFCGDAYKSREPNQTQQREFAKRINRLSTSGIPVFLLIGNHDLPNAIGWATSTEIFDTLAIDKVYVSNRPDIYRIPTACGIIQIASLPWLRRSALLSQEDNKNLSFKEVNRKIEEVLSNIVEASTAKLDPALPTILAAHVWVYTARTSSEKTMTIGHDPMLLPGNVANPAFDYIALGHIHKHQVLSPNPPVVYAGSLERLDFSEENDDKGFCVVEISPGTKPGKRQTSFEFHQLNGRRFLTLDINIEENDIDPTTTILRSLSTNEDRIPGAIIRLNISLPSEAETLLRDKDIHSMLKEAYHITVSRDIRQIARSSRLGKWTAEEIQPLDALKTYLEVKKTSPDRTNLLLEYGKKLIEDNNSN
ncbi:exonuclease SbcCD subunit D [Chloroflexota bacterium]